MEHNDRMSLAWHVARLNAYAPQKSADFVKLDALLSKGAGAIPKQSWQSQLASVEGWVKSRKR
jgi:hypothetical protein